MLHLECGSLSSFRDREGFILFPNPYFDVDYEENWLSDSFGRKVIETIDRIKLGSDVLHSLLEAGMHPEDLCTGTKNLLLCKHVDKLNHMSKMGENCYPFLLDIADTKDVHMAVTSFCWIRNDALKGRLVHFVNDDSYITDEMGFLDKITEFDGVFE